MRAFLKRTTGFEPATLSLGSRIGLLTGRLRAHGDHLSPVFRPRFFRYFPVARYQALPPKRASSASRILLPCASESKRWA
jgi:hypothetical protein